MALWAERGYMLDQPHCSAADFLVHDIWQGPIDECLNFTAQSQISYVLCTFLEMVHKNRRWDRGMEMAFASFEMATCQLLPCQLLQCANK